MSGSGVVVFNYTTWAAQYPELAVSVSAPQAQGYFNQAALYLDNTGCSVVCDASPGGKRETILYMITAHIAAILAPINGNPASPLVGRISNATEGSVSVGTDFPTTPTNAWWVQTKYGALAWQALAAYRTALYIAPPQIPLAQQSFPGAFGFFGGRGAWR